MKITAIRVYLVGIGFRNGIFTEIETDAQITGVSETVMKRRSRTIATYIDELSRFLIGKDPTRIEDLVEKMYRDSFWVGGPLHATAISAVEIALWDIVGKELGVPIYRLFGGPTRDAVLVYAHCASGGSPAQFARNVRERQQQGYRAIKTTLPVFYGASSQVLAGADKLAAVGYSGTAGAIDRSHKETEYLPANIFKQIAAYFAAARDAVGDEMGLGIDCHGRLSPANAVRLAEALAPYDLMFVEEPIPPENFEALAWVNARSPLPIATGERTVTVYDATQLLSKQAVAIYQPDVVNCGGLAQARKMAAVAEGYYVGVAPHNPNGPMCTAASVHLAASIPNFTILETIGSPEERELAAELVDAPLEMQDGYLPLPKQPGLGMNLNHAVIERYAYQPFEGYR
ncbi:MAG: mandelate racemase/muconate lactonizing enzyme family protein [Anaerolineae bacterium]|nr:mandelate racemase/muconate lactonizing enzyme family protein [Anaerolineae bacterium]